MRDINRSLKILAQKYGMWILLFSVVLLVAQTVSVQMKLETIQIQFEDHYQGILPMDSIENTAKIQKQESHRLEKKYGPEDIKKLNEIALKNYDRVKGSSYSDDQMTIEDYQYFLISYGDYSPKDEEHFFRSDSQFMKILTEVTELDGTSILSNGYGVVLFLAAILGIILTSGEHLTSFYQFSRTTPWPRWKDLMAKTLLGLVTVTLLFALIVALNYFILQSSPIRALFALNHLDDVFSRYLACVATYFFVLGIGSFAGNFLGHLGMLLVGYLGIELYTWDIQMIFSVITRTDNFRVSFIERILKQVDNLPDILRVMISPMRVIAGNADTTRLPIVLGFLLLGLIYLALGFLYHEHSNAERSGMMILPPWLAKFIFAMAVITTTVILSSMFFFFGTVSAGYFGYVAFVLFFFISYKVYRVLFGIRIGL